MFGVPDPKKLWRRYVVALGLIFLFLMGSHLSAVLTISGTHSTASDIDNSGRQRMLSQRILYFATEHAKAQDNAFAEDLTAAIDSFETAHIGLLIASNRSDDLKEIYFSDDESIAVNTLSINYIKDARSVLERSPQAADALARMQEVGPYHLLQRLNTAVQEFENYAQKKVDELSFLQSLSIASAVIILFLEALFIFWPAHKITISTLLKLEKKQSELEKAHTDAVDRNKELEETRSHLHHESRHDALTGLANRRYLDTELSARAEELSSSGGKLALLHIDLDRFKQINDSLGHAAGDHVLEHVASVLRKVVSGDDFVARVGGDEFVIACSGEASTEKLSGISRELIYELSKPIKFGDSLCHFGASIGIGIAQAEGLQIDPDKLMVNADIALYRAKEQGRGCHVFFTPDMQQQVDEGKKITDNIREALNNGDFIPYYQPQFDTETMELAGAEVLVRWQSEEGLLEPEKFLPVAEVIGAIPDIDRVMLEQAANDFGQWRDQGLTVPLISVNVSAKRLHHPDFITSLRYCTIPPENLVLELVESIFFEQQDEQFFKILDEVKRLGIATEIDDFGTGHSSIVSLSKISPKGLKIDQQIIEPIANDASARELLKAILDIANSMGITVVAEGVETEAQVRVLKDYGCQRLQGFWLGKPMPADEFFAFVTSYSGSKAA